MKVKTNCSYCGEEIYKDNDQICKYDSHFCNTTCQRKYNDTRILVSCNWCGKDKLISPSTYKYNKSGKFYCDQKCMGEWRSVERSGEKSPNKKEKIKGLCDFCGKEIEYYPCKVIWDYHFCNKECQGGFQSINRIGDKNPLFKSFVINCDWCNKKITRQPYRIKNFHLQFCNNECKGKWQSKFSVGENSPNWLGGDKDYPQEFNNELKTVIKERDKYSCQLCGTTNENDRLCCHHINYLKEDCRNKNLITLCHNNGCHPMTNGNREYWTTYFQKMLKEKFNYQY